MTSGTATTKSRTTSQRPIASALMIISRRTYTKSAASTLAFNPSRVLLAAKSLTPTTLLYVRSVDCKCAEGISSRVGEWNGGGGGREMDFFTFYNSTEDLCSFNSISFLCIYSLQKPVETIILHSLPVSQLLFLMWYPRLCLIQLDPETLTGSGSPPMVNFLFIRVPPFPHERVQFLLPRGMVRQLRCGEVC